MELEVTTVEVYLRHAFGQMSGVVDRLGDEKVNLKPHGPHTNSVAALVVHCCEVAKFWLGHVGLDKPSQRDRDAEFEATATVAELLARIDEALAQAVADVAAMQAGPTALDHPVREIMPGGDTSDAAVVLHVIEELFQHLGHMELTADALAERQS